MKVKDVMRTSVVSLPQNAPLPEVLQRFVKNRLEAMPILDAAERVVGLIAVHDLVDLFLPRYYEMLRDLAALEDKGQLTSLFDLSFTGMDLAAEKLILAADLMKSNLHWVNAEDGLLSAASRLQAQRQPRLPVIDRDRKLVGMIHDSDIALALLQGSAKSLPAKSAAR
jgi:CBS domain-containing protein